MIWYFWFLLTPLLSFSLFLSFLLSCSSLSLLRFLFLLHSIISVFYSSLFFLRTNLLCHHLPLSLINNFFSFSFILFYIFRLSQIFLFFLCHWIFIPLCIFILFLSIEFFLYLHFIFFSLLCLPSFCMSQFFLFLSCWFFFYGITFSFLTNALFKSVFIS